MRVMKRADAKDTESKDASELLGAGTGVAVFSPEDSSGAPAPAVGDKPGAVAGEDAGTERPQRADGGAATLQTEGREAALVRSRVTPREALFLKPSQIHSGPDLTTVLSPEQHVPSGFSTVLPLVTNDKQSAMFSINEEQSTAIALSPDINATAVKIMRIDAAIVLDAIVIERRI
uniref:Uncharacterized protein n=1 Tax=Noccaea caerulescens TaxID=107243 RepID=A0A1J3EBI1_NOCCA